MEDQIYGQGTFVFLQLQKPMSELSSIYPSPPPPPPPSSAPVDADSIPDEIDPKDIHLFYQRFHEENYAPLEKGMSDEEKKLFRLCGRNKKLFNEVNKRTEEGLLLYEQSMALGDIPDDDE